MNQILPLLLNQHRAISLYDLENTVFVSRSTLLSDLKRAAEILQKYDLELMRGSNKVTVDGNEINKRRCLSEENLLLASTPSLQMTEEHDFKNKVKNLLVETCVAFKRTVSEVTLNNSILLLEISIRRMREASFIDSGDLDIQEDITAESVISEEIHDFILDALRGIRRTFGLDLTDDLNLRIDLSLHCTALVVRMKYQMQMQNQMLDYIRQNYPQGFDIASYFASLLQEKFHQKISDEEIAFIAIHIYRAVTEQQRKAGKKRLLVLSSLRRSENILLRQTLVNWFSEQIAELYFVFPEDMDESFLERYDTFVTTEKGKYYDVGLAVYINPFPDKHDYLNLKLAMDGFQSTDDILNIFQRDLFFYFDGKTDKEAILRAL